MLNDPYDSNPQAPSAVVAQCICPKCQAAIQPTDRRCWLCSARLESVNPYGQVVPGPESQSSALRPNSALRPRESANAAWDWFAWAILGLCVGLALLVGIGIAVDSPGGLVPYAIVVVPSLLATLVRGVRDAGPQGELRPQKLLFTLITSSIMTVGILALLAVAAIGLLFLYCVAETYRR